jgi:hypothetical protein
MLTGYMRIGNEYIAALISANQIHPDFERVPGIVAYQKGHRSCDDGSILVLECHGIQEKKVVSRI